MWTDIHQFSILIFGDLYLKQCISNMSTFSIDQITCQLIFEAQVARYIQQQCQFQKLKLFHLLPKNSNSGHGLICFYALEVIELCVTYYGIFTLSTYRSIICQNQCDIGNNFFIILLNARECSKIQSAYKELHFLLTKSYGKEFARENSLILFQTTVSYIMFE